VTNKQRVFVEEYLRCWNATEAARRAGYAEQNARFMGAENLTKLNIQAEIKARIDEKAMSADEVLLRLADQARATMEDVGEISEMGTFRLDLAKARKNGKLGVIKKLKTVMLGYEIELYDAQAALVHIGKAHRLFIDRAEVKHEGSIDVGGDADLGEAARMERVAALLEQARARRAGADPS
jgi:hypothetical protein